MLFLNACAAEKYNFCPPLKEYTPEEQYRMAEKIDSLPEGDIVIEWISDYIALRDMVRACQNGK